MKVAKIILGMFLIISLGNEFVRAGFQIGSFFNLGVVVGVLLMLVLVAWLLGSSMTINRLNLKSWTFLKIYLLSLLGFLLIAFISLFSKISNKEYVEYNGVKVSIDIFDRMSKKTYPNDKERREFILCIVEKLANSEEIATKYRKELENGHLDVIFNKIASREIQSPIGMEECYTLAKREWTLKLKV